MKKLICKISIMLCLLAALIITVLNVGNTPYSIAVQTADKLSRQYAESFENSIVPDALFFVEEENEVFVFGYKDGGLYDCGESYEVKESLDTTVAEITKELENKGYVKPVPPTPQDVWKAKDKIDQFGFNPDYIRIRDDVTITEHFPDRPATATNRPNTPFEPIGTGEITTDAPIVTGTPGTTDSPIVTESPNPTNQPVVTDTPIGGEYTITYLPGDPSTNGGGVKDDGSMPNNEQRDGGDFAVIPDDKIPHSVTLNAGNTNAYAFTHWLGSDGLIYYPGDAIFVTEDLTLTAQWEAGYDVIMDWDDYVTYCFRALDNKSILGRDISLAIDSANMLPTGLDFDNATYTPFTGIFDGAGYEVSFLCLESGYYSIHTAMFYYNKGILRNFDLEIQVVYTNSPYAAAVACFNDGDIRNVDVTHGVRSGYHYGSGYDIAHLNTREITYLGVIVGQNYATGLISGCDVDDVTIMNYEKYTGGIAGHNEGVIEKCSTKDVYIALTINEDEGGAGHGGIAGYNKGIIRECTVSGLSVRDVGAYSPITFGIGGIAGVHAREGKISDCLVLWGGNTQPRSGGGYYMSGVFVGSCSGDIQNCIGIGNTAGTDVAFDNYPEAPLGYSGGRVMNCYLVGRDLFNVGVIPVTMDDLKNMSSAATGLPRNLWSFTGDIPQLPCNW